MNATATSPKAFAVWFKDLDRWDYLSLYLQRLQVNVPLVKVGNAFSVRKTVVSTEDLESGAVSMVDRVSFDGEIFAGKEKTRMTQYLALPGDIVVSKIRARQGSVGLVNRAHGPLSVTIHYRVLTPDAEAIDAEYAWLAFRSQYGRAQFLAATGGAMKGEISEDALLEVALPCPPLPVQRAIVRRWQEAQEESNAARGALERAVAALNDRLGALYRRQTTRDVIHSRCFVLDFKDLNEWDTKSSRAAAYRLACPAFRPMGEFIEEATELVRPFEEPDKEWPVYGVNNKEGAFFNTMRRGTDFNAPYKRIRKGWFFHNPTRSAVGSLGIVPDVPADAITSPEYQVWRVKDGGAGGILPGYVAVLLQTPFFIDVVQFHRVGAVKQRMYVDNLREVRIPYIDVSEQRQYAKAREDALAAMQKAKAHADKAKAEVEEMIMGTRPVKRAKA